MPAVALGSACGHRGAHLYHFPADWCPGPSAEDGAQDRAAFVSVFLASSTLSLAFSAENNLFPHSRFIHKHWRSYAYFHEGIFVCFCARIYYSRIPVLLPGLCSN